MCEYQGEFIKRKIEKVTFNGHELDQISFVCPECEEPVCVWCGSHELPIDVPDDDDGFRSECPTCGRDV